MKALNSIFADDMARTERESWQPKESASFRLNFVVNGYGFSREFKELSDDGYSGITRKQALEMCKKMKQKGFEVSCYYLQNKSERLV